MFTLRGCVSVRLIRNPRNTNWDSFKGDIRDRLESCPRLDMKGETGLGLVNLLKQVCHSLWWTVELESLRRLVRRIFNMCRSKKNPHSWALCRETQRNYRKDVRKASRNAWRTFCGSINDLPRSAWLYKALSMDPKI